RYQMAALTHNKSYRSIAASKSVLPCNSILINLLTLATYPPNPLPLFGKGENRKERGFAPLLKSLPDVIGIKGVREKLDMFIGNEDESAGVR
ncbi:MAG: hypothetical protein Q8O05_07695, partial [Chloroflexota bacterium]|nr:hypothetical protein [Chloroflexota bacterium]